MAEEPELHDWLSGGAQPSWQPAQQPNANRRRWKGAGLVAAGVVAGGVLAGAIGASAASGSSSSAPASYSAGTYAPSGSTGSTANPRGGDHDGDHRGGPAGGMRGDEKSVSSTLQQTLTQQAQAAVPGGTVDRVETDSGDATYEAHVTKSDGSKVTVKFDKSGNVTAVEDGMGK